MLGNGQCYGKQSEKQGWKNWAWWQRGDGAEATDTGANDRRRGGSREKGFAGSGRSSVRFSGGSGPGACSEQKKAEGTAGLDGVGPLAHPGTLAFIPSEVSVGDHEHGQLREMQE